MRFYLDLTPNKEDVPFNYQSALTGTFHKWLGLNDIHNEISLYSLSWLSNAKVKDNHLEFPKGSRWYISFWDENIGRKMLSTILEKPEACFGMKVSQVQIVETPNFSDTQRFVLSSPILIRNRDGENYIHYTFADKESDSLLTSALRRKLDLAGIDSTNAKVWFDKSYLNAKTKVVTIHNIKNKANFCPVFVSGGKEITQFAWNVGIGHSTGSAFGSLV